MAVKNHRSRTLERKMVLVHGVAAAAAVAGEEAMLTWEVVKVVVVVLAQALC